VPLESDRRRIEALGRPADSALRVHQLLQTKPILSIPDAVTRLGISAPTVGKSVRHLEALGLARELTGKQRRRVFAYDAYLNILNRGTEPLPR
jgi:Fic family protein